MLNVKKLSHDVLPEVRQAIMEFRRGHVSRFPIDVESREYYPNYIRFVDSRFPTTAWNKDRCLALLDVNSYDTKARRIYRIAGRLVRNEKYAQYNDEYYAKTTTDPKKLLKMLRDYVKPLTALEIMDKTSGSVEHDLYLWKDSPKDQFRGIVRDLRDADIAEEIMYLQSVGVQFRSDKFRRVVSEGLGLYEEAKRREQARYSTVHVFLQPDESVVVSSAAGTSLPAGSWTFQTMEEAPQWVQHQVAMLRMCEAGGYIPEVGRKVTDVLYWVHVRKDDFNIANA